MTEAQQTILDKALAMEPERDEITRRILAEAQEQFSRFGLRRTSMEDVARRAGVSRVTIYRRFENKNVLIEQAILRGLNDFFVEFVALMRTLDTLEDRIVEGFILALRTARDNPLLGGMLTAEPETMLPFMTINGGPLVAALGDFLAGHLMRSRVQHSVSEADIPVVSEMMVRLSVSFLLTPDSRIDLGSDEALREFARRHIVPMVLGRP